MGGGISLFACFKGAPPQAPEPIEPSGHSFCYIPSPPHSACFVSPSDSLRFSTSDASLATASAAPPATTVLFKSISGASIGANASAPTTVANMDLSSSHESAANDLSISSGIASASAGFESSASFSAIPLQPLPRLVEAQPRGSLDDRSAGDGFRSGPIELGIGSGPLDSLPFSAPLRGADCTRRRKRRRRVAISRSFSDKQRPGVVPVLNFIAPKATPPSDAAADAIVEDDRWANAHWAQVKAGEDRVHVVVSKDHGWLFVGIYDGFNGPDAPEFLMGNLYRALFDELEGLFWEKIEGSHRDFVSVAEPGTEEEVDLVPFRIAKSEQQDGADSSERSHMTNLRLDSESVRRVSFESESKMCSARRKPLWEFLAEVDDDDYIRLGISRSERFALSDFYASFLARKSTTLLSKIKCGFSRQMERNRKLFPRTYDWKDREKVRGDCRPVDGSQRAFARRSKLGPADHAMVLEALSRALEATEVAYLEMTDNVLHQNPEVALMGSCLLVVLMKDQDVYVMNVGDSRAIVAQYQPQRTGSTLEPRGRGHDDGEDSQCIMKASSDAGESVLSRPTDEPAQVMELTALQLSTDHSTSIQEEVMRIKEEHPDDSHCIVNDRVKGRLMVTRAFGAGFLKQPKWNNAVLEVFRNDYIGTKPYITCCPSLCHYELGPNDQFLVLSSDGLYQYLTNQEVVSNVENFMMKFPDGDPAQHLIELLLIRAAKKAGICFHDLLEIPQGDRRKYHDDVTVMVISLEGRIWKSFGKVIVK